MYCMHHNLNSIKHVNPRGLPALGKTQKEHTSYYGIFLRADLNAKIMEDVTLSQVHPENGSTSLSSTPKCWLFIL